MRYYIVGYMYSGKSTFGRQLAIARGLEFVDLDQLFEERYHYTVARFFSQFGEKAFRTLETQMLHSTETMDEVVVATGGGTPCSNGNMDFILAHGTAIYLQMKVDDLLERALHSHNPRPLMRGLDAASVREKIAQQLAEREPYYLRAPIVINGMHPSVEMVEALWLKGGK